MTRSTATQPSVETPRHEPGEVVEQVHPMPVPVVAAAAWLLPGMGHFLIGLRVRGVVIGGTILLLFVAGLLIGGVRVIDVPGYQDEHRLVGPDGRWVLTSRPMAAVFQRPWYIPQILAGPVAIAASYGSIRAAADFPKPTARLGEIGTLYCAVAGMLNLLALLDASGKAGAASAARRTRP